ncbi:MAG TPA: amidohydrolase family protein [Polyangiales bacterium]|nr:amidohydrolase family protein [Polyangiales bacterium]
MKRVQWLKRKKTQPELPLEPPIRLGNMSNGEFFHQSTPREQRIRAEILRQADEKSRKVGVDRREFLASAMGMCTSLSVLNLAAACSSEGKRAAFIDMGAGTSGSGVGAIGAGSPSVLEAGRGGASEPASMPASANPGISGIAASGSSGAGASATGQSGSRAGVSGTGGAGGMGGSSKSGSGGGFVVPEEATMNCAMAEDLLNGKGEFIFDCQTHHVDMNGEWRTTDPFIGDIYASFLQQYNHCREPDLKTCIDGQAYLEKVFLQSETTLAVLSGFPAALCTDGRRTACGAALDNDAMWRERDEFNMIGRSQRVVNHCQVNPTDNLPLQLAIMERIKKEHGCWGFKTYTEWGPNGTGWWLDDPKSGIPFIEKARELDSKIICVHKGLVFPGWDAAYSDPKDVGVVAKMYPDTAFLVYHSAIEVDLRGEGPYDPSNTLGTDRLCRTVEKNDLKGKNVYAELGAVWGQIMNMPEKAQHVIGKLLKYCGEDNVVWGSECVWMGSPQPQIEAFRMFQISKAFQDMYGYPELTPELKAKIFGLNAAKIYKIDPNEVRCAIRQTKLSALKEVMDGELGPRRWAFGRGAGPITRREFWNLARLTGGRPGV